MERKEFIKSCGMACFGMATLSMFMEGCAGITHYAVVTQAPGKLIVKKSEFNLEESPQGKKRRFVVVRNETLNFPICLFRLNENEFSALRMECTHNSCELNIQGDFLICPCHGSEFTNRGKVQNPPAEQNLKAYNLTTDDENIYIQY